jgi:hypothetical protein
MTRNVSMNVYYQGYLLLDIAGVDDLDGVTSDSDRGPSGKVAIGSGRSSVELQN